MIHRFISAVGIVAHGLWLFWPEYFTDRTSQAGIGLICIAIYILVRDKLDPS